MGFTKFTNALCRVLAGSVQWLPVMVASLRCRRVTGRGLSGSGAAAVGREGKGEGEEGCRRAGRGMVD